jgi:hypothetical protein
MVQLIVNDGTADSAPDAVLITAQAAPQNPGEPTPLPTGGGEIEEEDRDDEDEIDDDDDKYESDDDKSEKSDDRGKRYGRKKPFKHERGNDRDDD